MVTKIGIATFAGTSHVFNGTLATVIRALAQGYARNAVIDATPDDLTDNSGGTAGAAIEVRSKLDAHVLSGSDSTPKAGLETALGTVLAAVHEIGTKANELAALLGLDELTLPTGTSDGTIGAVTVTVAGSNTALAPVAGVNAKLTSISAYISAVAAKVNEVSIATGFDPVPDASKDGKLTTVFTGLDAGVGTAVTGAAGGNEGVLATSVNAELAKFANNVATMAAKLSEVIGSDPMPPSVIAA